MKPFKWVREDPFKQHVNGKQKELLMLLRIIDRGDDALEVVFQSPLLNKSFPIEFYDSPVYSNFQQSLAWYFRDYPLLLDKASVNDKVQQLVPRLIAFGQAMGEKLSGEDFELVAITEHIEQTGYPQLQVRFESDDVAFFDDVWEATVLPEAKYMLSCIAQGFTRTFVEQPLEDLNVGLQVTLPVNDEMAALMQSAPVEGEAEQQVNNPLKITKWLSRGVDDKGVASNSLNASINAHQQGALNVFNIVNPADNKALHLALDCHVLHYDGAIVISDDKPFFQLTGGDEHQLVSVAEVAQMMLEHKVPSLFVQPSAVVDASNAQTEGSRTISPQQALAMVAKAAQLNGIGNVVGLNQLTPCWVGDLCFEQLYSAINKGFTVAQAVIEARKALQANVQIDLVELEANAFHPWSLLNHYGHQKLQYFVSGHKVADETTPPPKDFYERLLGFKTQMLPPLLRRVSDGQAISVYHQLEQQSKVNLVGERGSGKTQLGHMIALHYAQQTIEPQAKDTQPKVDFCFYFDFSTDEFQPVHLQQMIAPVLGLDVDDIDKVDELLAQKRCLFVFDNCDQMNAEVAKFINQHWQSAPFKMLFIGQSVCESIEGCDVVIEQQPLSFAEQQLLVANRLRQLGINKPPKQAWYDTLAKINGNPWLIEQLTPTLSENKPEVLNGVIAELNDSTNSDSLDKVNCFYQYQWQQLDTTSQRLLLLVSQVNGLLLEMLMIAFDQKAPQSPAVAIRQQLMNHLGGGDKSFADYITQWQKSGFVALYPHGRLLEGRCLAFLDEQVEQGFADLTEQQEQIDLCFSQLLCQGVSMLSQHVIKEPNPNITNNLLLNRRQWVKHFERLWFNQDFRGFMAVKQVFEQLLIQAKILEDMNAWLFDLLKRTEPVTLGIADKQSTESRAEDAAKDMMVQLSWLSVGANTLSDPKTPASEHDHFVTMAQRAQTWLDSQNDDIEQNALPLMQQVVTYLEKYYQHKADWQQCAKVCEISLGIYRQHEAWQRVISVSRSLALCYHQLGEQDKTLECEAVIINEVPYDGAPDGFKQQQLMDVLFARLARKDLTAAQTLLDQLKQQLDMGPMMGMLEGVQCDIHYQNGDYTSAVPYLCRTWAQSQGDSERLKQIHPRLIELSEKIGEQAFDQLFAENASEECVHPSDFQS